MPLLSPFVHDCVLFSLSSNLEALVSNLPARVANDTGFETRPAVVAVAVAVVELTRLLAMSSFFRHSHTHRAAVSALTAVLHPRSSNSSLFGNLTAPDASSAPQNGTGLGNFTITNITMANTGGGGSNGTSLSPAVLQRINKENYGPQINFTIWLLTALSAMFLALRVYCKFLRHRGLWWDDYILIASWVRTPRTSLSVVQPRNVP